MENKVKQQDMVFSPKVVQAGAGPGPDASMSVQGTPLTVPGLPAGEEGGGRAARTRGCPAGVGVGGHPSHRPFREALAARACSDVCLPLALQRPSAWPCTTVACGGREGRRPARKRSVGWPESSLTPRAGPGLSHTGRDKPGVLTSRPGLWFPGDGMLDIRAGRVEKSQAQLGRKGHVPGWSCWRRGGEAERCLARGVPGEGGH